LNINESCKIIIDRHSGYNFLKKSGFVHGTLIHYQRGGYKPRIGRNIEDVEITTNRIEGVWS